VIDVLMLTVKQDDLNWVFLASDCFYSCLKREVINLSIVAIMKYLNVSKLIKSSSFVNEQMFLLSDYFC